MKSLTHSLPAKVASVFLLIMLSVTLLASALGVTFAYANNLYQEYTPFFYDTQMCEDITKSYASQIASHYLDGALGSEPYYDWYYAQDNCNLGFRILDSQGNVLVKNYTPQDIGYQQTVEFSSFSVECLVTSPIEAKDQYYLYYRLYELINPIRYQLIVLLVISVIAFFADLVFLCCAAGHRKTTDELVLNFQDKIPLDLYLVAMGTAIFLAVQACAEFTYNAYDLFLSVLLLLFVAVPIIFALGLAVFMTCVTRLKVGRWWKNTIVYRA